MPNEKVLTFWGFPSAFVAAAKAEKSTLQLHK